MALNSALVFNLAQVPINTEHIKVSTTQPVIVAPKDIQPLQIKKAQVQPLVGVLIFIIVILGLIVGWLFQKSRSQEGFFEQSQEEFAISIKISNVRTKDYFRAEIEGTVYVKIEDETKAISLQSQEGIITHDSVADVLEDRLDSAMRQVASEMDLEEIHTERKKFCKEVQELLKNSFTSLGLSLNDNAVVVGNVDESNNYNPNNYFDVQAIQKRTETIQKATLETRKTELDIKPQIREQELKIQQEIREKELAIELEARMKELDIKPKIREKELEIEEKIREAELAIEGKIREKELAIEQTIADKELDFQQAHLIQNHKLETQKIDYEIELENYKNTKENDLEKTMEVVELETSKEIEIQRAIIEKEIQIAKIKEDTEVDDANKKYQILQAKNRVSIEEEIEKSQNEATAQIQLAKIIKDKEVAHQNKDFQSLQSKLEQELEQEEIQAVIQMIEKEKEKLAKEKERARAIEAITTAVEEAQVERENIKTELIKNGRLAAEAEIIRTLAEAEEMRYKAVPGTDVDRLVKLIRDEIIGKDKLKEIQGVIKALSPQPGVLGNSSIYTFASGKDNGEDINRLMRSASGMQLINSLLNGKLGEILEPKLAENNGDNNGELSRLPKN
ncbi:MAG: SPFH domain-containing protein [Crocosphaera sp.]|nr:SPFH domain-containing protein [Crocosphaera sp.]